MTHFRFDGNWEFKLHLPAFKKYTNTYKNSAEKDEIVDDVYPLEIDIMDHMEESPDPYHQQIAAIHFLISNQEQIVRAIDQGLFKIYPEFRRMAFEEEYDLEEIKYHDLVEPEDMSSWLIDSYPAIKHPDDMHKVAWFCRARILTEHKEGVSYIEFSAGCSWDEEHGHSFILHKDRVVEMTGYEGSDEFAIQRDQGIDIEKHKAELIKKNKDRQESPPAPVMHYPHPKYGKLREWQADDNRLFWMRYLRHAGEKKFIAWYESTLPEFEEQYKPKPVEVFNYSCHWASKEIFNHFHKKYSTDRSQALKNCVTSMNKPFALELLKSGERFATHGRERPLYIYFNQFSRIHPTDPNQPLNEKYREMLEWLYSLGHRPIEGENENDFRALERMDHSRLVVFSDILCKLALKYTQPIMRNDASSEEKLKYVHLKMRKQSIMNKCINSLLFPQQYSCMEGHDKITLSYLVAEGHIPGKEYFPRFVNANDIKSTNAKNIEDFLHGLYKKYNPVAWQAVNPAQNEKLLANHEIKVISDVLKSEARKEDVKSVFKIIFKVLKLFK